MNLKTLLGKTFRLLEGLSPEWQACLGALEPAFVAIVWGSSGNGKTNFVMQLVAALTRLTTVLYVSLEESFSLTLQNTLHRQEGFVQKNFQIADHTTDYDSLFAYLSRRRTPRVVVIDSLQYFAITYVQYKQLKTAFPSKAFIFISHEKGKLPDGKTAHKIRYDAGLKIRVEGFVAFIASRYGGNRNWVIWEEGAKKKWGKQYNKIIKR